MRERVLFFDLLRCVAAVAVIAIHVLAPYRELLGTIPFSHWATAVSINSVTRWAVPVFILITGALMLSDTRPFAASYYIKRRLGKVLLPFVVWSLFYAYLSGWSASGFDVQQVQDVLAHSPQHATYYHLGFFYYFIPLYVLIPIFHWLVMQGQDRVLYAYTSVWLITTALYLLGIDGIWSHELWLYSGYLPLGYLLFHRFPDTGKTVLWVSLLGLAALALTATMLISNSLEAGQYSVGRWLSYKTLNVVLAATMVFALCRYVAAKLPSGWWRTIGLVSRHSLGIYLLHPIFLWPMKAFGWHQGNPAWVIPLWIVLSGAGALALSYLFSLSAKTRWLLP